MSVIFILIIIGVLVAGLFLAGFIWAVKSGQYDDTYTPSIRMLFEDGPAVVNDKPKKSQNSDSEKKNGVAGKQSELINKPK